MKKSILSASIAAMIGGLGLAGVANAGVHPAAAEAAAAGIALVGAASVADVTSINEAGTGHILVVPYFTTQGTNATLLNITNTDVVNGKLVKVRFRGASNSDDIFDFTLTLSPGDVWAAKVSQGADGRSQLETSDKSCTLPAAVATQKNSFPTTRLPASFTDAQKAAETREGYIEILTMADIPKAGTNDQAATVAAIPAVNPLFTAVKHVSGVAPCTAAALDLLKTDSTAYRIAAAGAAGVNTTSAQGKGLSYPSGMLMANWTIIDTVKTATFSGSATAVRAANAGANALANVVFFPQSDDAVTGTYDADGTGAGAGVLANINRYSADPLFRTTDVTRTNNITAAADTRGFGASPANTAVDATNSFPSALIAASFYDLPDLSTPYIAADVTNPAAAAANANLDPLKAADRLTRQLAAKSVINEYLTTTSIGATTDWVFSMPTRRYNVAMNYGYASNVGGDGRVYTNWAAANAAAGVVNYTLSPAVNYFTSANTSVSTGKICVAADTGANGVNQYDREETTTSTQFVISPGTVTNVRFCGETSVLAINNGTNTASGSLSATLALQNLNVNANEGWIVLGTSGIANAGLPVLGGAFAKSSAFGAMWAHRYTR